MNKPGRPRILFVDAYDSFTNNIVSLLETSLNVEVSTVKIDTEVGDLNCFLDKFVAVVAGPGPGDPRNPGDTGLFQKLWELDVVNLIPVLGICLGFQSLVLAYGGEIKRLPEPRHGIVRKVLSNERSIFHGVPSLEAVQYHSLYATLGAENYLIQDARRKNQRDNPEINPDLTPLAWDYWTEHDAMHAVLGRTQNPQSILMAVKHTEKPFYGIQFHPESICSSLEARKIIKNWWDEICIWRARARKQKTLASNGLSGQPHTEVNHDISSVRGGNEIERKPHDQAQRSVVVSKVIDLGNLTLPSICETVGSTVGDSIIFDSERRQMGETGEFSIIGIIETTSLRFEYRVGTRELLEKRLEKASPIDLKAFDDNIFGFLESYMEKRKADNGDPAVPFWGGLMGYISYEACLETLDIKDKTKSNSPRGRPDLGFAFIERSIVIDHMRQMVHIQSIKPTDRSWVDAIALDLSMSSPTTGNCLLKTPLNAVMSLPSEKQYKSWIRACQDEIRAGNAYELCLTNQARITLPLQMPAWAMYNRLRAINPAPFGAFIRLGDLTVLSSSPERFMRWSRPRTSRTCSKGYPRRSSKATSILQFRPIKGTIARRATAASAPRSLGEATRLLSTQKEQAENLMIVDLIRHDLHGIVGSGRVSVPKLMVVEEYETVFQLVSVIEGSMIVKAQQKSAIECGGKAEKINGNLSNLPNGSYDSHMFEILDRKLPLLLDHDSRESSAIPSMSRQKPSSPLAALPATLPPGSMTGAPKLRSCQILRSLEATPRGVYSGIIGYIDVGGGGDWSVAIRCATRWDDPGNTVGDHWTVGAGGAVTALSTEQGEWEEMLAKLQATLRIFQD